MLEIFSCAEKSQQYVLTTIAFLLERIELQRQILMDWARIAVLRSSICRCSKKVSDSAHHL